jgi:hypothetical protein
MIMPKGKVEVGQVYEKVGAPRPHWRVNAIFQHLEGPHAQLISLDDPTRQITLAADALLDKQLMIRVADSSDAPSKTAEPAKAVEPPKRLNDAA